MTPKVCHHCEYPLSQTQRVCPECGRTWQPGKLSRREIRNRWLAGAMFFVFQAFTIVGSVRWYEGHRFALEPEIPWSILCGLVTFASACFVAGVGLWVSTDRYAGVRASVFVNALIIALPVNLISGVLVYIILD